MNKNIKRSKKNFSNKGRYEAYLGNMVYFASNAIADRYLQLVKLQENKRIIELEINPQFSIVVHNKRLGSFNANFRYFTLEDNNHRGYCVVENIKNIQTDLYKLKKQLVELSLSMQIHDIPAEEIKEWTDRIPLNQ